MIGPFDDLRARCVFCAFLLCCALTAVCASSDTASGDDAQKASPFRIGVLFDQSGPLGEFGQAGRSGVELALAQVNAAGGVFGQPVEVVFADAGSQVEATVNEARRLVEDEGVHVLIGPFGSAAALALASAVSGPFSIPTITPTATSPELTHVSDSGFLFRTTVSDAAQAPLLAALAESEGYEHVGVLYLNDAYGKGLLEAFGEAYKGQITAVAVEAGESSYARQLAIAAAEGAEALIAIAYEPTTSVFLPEARKLGLFERFLLVDATISVDFIDTMGAAFLEGIQGTAPISSIVQIGKAYAAAGDFTSMFRAAYGTEPTIGIEANAYDITLCFSYTAEWAGGVDGAALRDALAEACGGGGQTFGFGADDVRAALEAIRAGKEINYEGAASAVEFDAAGDLASGEIGVWQFQSGELVEISRSTYAAGAITPALPTAVVPKSPEH